MYKPVDPRVSFPKMEEGVLAFWREKKTFRRSIENRRNAPEYILYDGATHVSPGSIPGLRDRTITIGGYDVLQGLGAAVYSGG